MRAAVVILALLLWSAPSAAQEAAPEGMARVKGGVYLPFFPGKERQKVAVADFYADARPVTNAQFLRFVQEHPRWQRGQIAPLFADSSYLSRWAGPLELGEARPAQPVTFVSWFSASAYCRAQGKSLPTEHQWEYMARADERRADATQDPAFTRRILEWYSHPREPQELGEVASSKPNVWGLYDLHGLIWEWVLDYSASILSEDGRGADDPNMARFCGGAALNASDVSDYAAFMRFAMRGSLAGAYTVHHLGFRCVQSIPQKSKPKSTSKP